MVDPYTLGNDNPVIAGGSTLNPQDGFGEPGFDRFAPLISVDELKEDFLFGIPLTSALTGQTLSDDSLKRAIARAISDFETSVRIAVSPVQMVDRCDFHRADDIQFGIRQLTRWPIIKVTDLRALWPGRNEALAGIDNGATQEISYPTSWVSLSDNGIVRIIPNSGSLVNADVNFVASSAYRSIVLGGLRTWPNMWRISYVAGFDFNKLPHVVNRLIGVMAAIQALSMLGPVIFPFAGQSISLDGMGQSVSTAGPQWLALRLQDLTAERDKLVLQMRAHYGTDLIMTAW